ncbi:hypothetical protein C2G38_2176427 [Gigaspora rosea]|uniref:Uncharacterized protein n=1 Tax=Gigaspora rosea TaxID=44941 RepID=A0A397VGB0_9GLOM|nr:hypothetical protein C2G38_2176427 [Gigaspora rosea]
MRLNFTTHPKQRLYTKSTIDYEVESIEIDTELERLTKELEQLNNSLEDTLNIYINKMSRPRPTYTTPRPTYYNYEEGYIVETSTRPYRHSYLLNRRRNLPVEELYNKCATLVKTLTDEHAAEFRQLVNEAIGNDYVDDVQFYQNLKIVIEILEDLIDGGEIIPKPVYHEGKSSSPCEEFPSVAPFPKNCPKKSQDSGDKEEPECLSLCTQPNASIKKNHPPYTYALKPCSVKYQFKRPRELKLINRGYCYQNGKGIKENTKLVNHYRKSAEIGHVNRINNRRPCYNTVNKNGAGKPSSGININREDNEAYEVDKKVAEVERVDEVTNLWECQDLAEVDSTNKSKLSRLNKKEEILKDKGPGGTNQEKLAKNDEENNEEKKISRTKRILEGEALNHACEIWKKKVKNFQRKAKQNKEVKEPTRLENRSSSTNNNDSLEPNIYNESKEICLDNKMKGKIKGHKGSKKTLSNNNKDKASASKNKLQDLPKDCDIMPEIARSLKLDESYRVALSAYGYIGVDIYIKYYQSAEIYYWNKAYNLGHRYRMGIHIEKGYKELEKLYIIQYIKDLEKDNSLYVPWYAKPSEVDKDKSRSLHRERQEEGKVERKVERKVEKKKLGPEPTTVHPPKSIETKAKTQGL